MSVKQQSKPKEERSIYIEDRSVMFKMEDLLARQNLITPDEKAKLTDLIRRNG